MRASIAHGARHWNPGRDEGEHGGVAGTCQDRSYDPMIDPMAAGTVKRPSANVRRRRGREALRPTVHPVDDPSGGSLEQRAENTSVPATRLLPETADPRKTETWDIETRTKTRAERDQVLRNIDVGSYYAGTRDFFFSLLVVSPETSPLGTAAVAEYSDFSKTRALLQAHRSDRLANLRAVTLLTWSDMAAVLTDARDSVGRVDERHYADRALEWMQVKGLVG